MPLPHSRQTRVLERLENGIRLPSAQLKGKHSEAILLVSVHWLIRVLPNGVFAVTGAGLSSVIWVR